METDKQRQAGALNPQSVDNGADLVAQGSTPLLQSSSSDVTDRQGNAPLPHPVFTRRGTLLASENQLEDKQIEWEGENFYYVCACMYTTYMYMYMYVPCTCIDLRRSQVVAKGVIASPFSRYLLLSSG